jgi:putative FmdB family regulatory protein
MPIYEYKCACGNTFDARNTIRKRRKSRCMHCGSMANKVDIYPIGGIQVDLGKPDWADSWTAIPKSIF